MRKRGKVSTGKERALLRKERRKGNLKSDENPSECQKGIGSGQAEKKRGACKAGDNRYLMKKIDMGKRMNRVRDNKNRRKRKGGRRMFLNQK